MVIVEKGLEDNPVRRYAVGPEVPTQEIAGVHQLLLDEGQRDLGRRGIHQVLEGHGLGPAEGLEQGIGQPGVIVRQRAAHAEQVHDGEDPGAPVVRRRGLDGILKQAADTGVIAVETGQGPGADERIDITRHHHVIQRAVIRCGLHRYVGWQFDANLFRPARLLHTAPDPGDVGRSDAVVVLQQAPGPDVGAELVLGNTDATPLEILGSFDPFVSANQNRGMPEGSREKGRYCDVVRISAVDADDIGAEGHFTDVEGLVPEGAEENLLR